MYNNIRVGGMMTGHVQGIATDKKREYMYYSFTTSLVKTDMQGNIIGSVKGLYLYLLRCLPNAVVVGCLCAASCGRCAAEQVYVVEILSHNVKYYMPNFAFRTLRVSRTLDFTLIKFTMPAACNSSVHAGAPATMKIALSPIAW